MPQPDQSKLDAFLGRMIGDLGAVASETLRLDGTWMIVRPRSAHGQSQSGLGLGAQAGEVKLRQVVSAGGFTRFRRAAETPFNMVLEARP